MDPSRSERIQELFAAAIEHPAGEREAYVIDSVADLELRAELLSLVKAHEGRGSLDSIAEHLASSASTEHVERLRAALGDRYDIARLIGRGGMAHVYLAEDLKHHRFVALKVLKPGLVPVLGPERFMREIDIAAQLAHPNILPLFDSGSADGLLYFVMPYVEGETLRSRLDRDGKLPADEAVQIAREIADALAYAHGRGLIHRDIKPENILFQAGHAVISDFGIARAIGEGEGENITESGMVVGTRAYMSPEQAMGAKSLDARTDIYALGCVLHEMLTGHPPAAGMTAIRMEPVVSDSLAHVVRRSVEPDPDDRYATATELAAALNSSKSARPRRNRAVIVAAAALAVAGGLTAALLGGFGRSAASAPDPQVIVVLPFRVTGTDTTLGSGVAELLATEFTGEGAPRAVDPAAVWRSWRASQHSTKEGAMRLAASLGAGRVLSGSMVGSGSRLTLSAVIYAVPDGREVARPDPVSGPADSLPLLVRRVTASLLTGARSGDPDARDPGTYSAAALRHYLAGQAAQHRGSYPEARHFFEQALALDSDFTLASLAAVLTARWAGGAGPETPRHRRLAWTQRRRLSPRDQALLMLELGERYPERTPTAEQLVAAERGAANYPDNIELWEELADKYFHSGLQLGFPDAPERAGAAFRRALALDSTFSSALFHLFDLAAARGDTAEARSWGARYLATAPSTEFAIGVRWRLAAMSRDGATIERLVQEVERGTVRMAWVIVTGELWDSIGMAQADRLLAAARRNTGTQADRDVVNELTGLIEFNRGRPGAARGTAMGLQVLEWLYGEGDSVAAAADARLYDRLAGAAPAATPDERARQYRAACFAGQWRAWHPQPALAHRAIERLSRAAAVPDSGRTVAEARTCAAALRAAVAVRSDAADADAMTARFDSVIRSGPVHRRATFNSPSMLDWELLLLSRLYESRGDDSAALAAVRRRNMWETYPRSPFLTASLRREGDLAMRLGDREGAIRAYRWYLTLMKDPDPALVPRRNAVEVKVAQLRRSQPRTTR